MICAVAQQRCSATVCEIVGVRDVVCCANAWYWRGVRAWLDAMERGRRPLQRARYR